MPRHLKRGILSASTKILSKDIDKYAFIWGSNFYETDVSKQLTFFIYTFQLSQQTGKIGMVLVADMWNIMTSIK